VEAESSYHWKAHISIDLITHLLEIVDDLDTIQKLRNGEMPLCDLFSMEDTRDHLSRILQELPADLEGHESIDDLLAIFLEDDFTDASLVRTEADDGWKIVLSIAKPEPALKDEK
jgi:hypothetical protein